MMRLRTRSRSFASIGPASSRSSSAVRGAIRWFVMISGSGPRNSVVWARKRSTQACSSDGECLLREIGHRAGSVSLRNQMAPWAPVERRQPGSTRYVVVGVVTTAGPGHDRARARARSRRRRRSPPRPPTPRKWQRRWPTAGAALACRPARWRRTRPSRPGRRTPPARGDPDAGLGRLAALAEPATVVLGEQPHQVDDVADALQAGASATTAIVTSWLP